MGKIFISKLVIFNEPRFSFNQQFDSNVREETPLPNQLPLIPFAPPSATPLRPYCYIFFYCRKISRTTKQDLVGLDPSFLESSLFFLWSISIHSLKFENSIFKPSSCPSWFIETTSFSTAEKFAELPNPPFPTGFGWIGSVFSWVELIFPVKHKHQIFEVWKLYFQTFLLPFLVCRNWFVRKLRRRVEVLLGEWGCHPIAEKGYIIMQHSCWVYWWGDFQIQNKQIPFLILLMLLI